MRILGNNEIERRSFDSRIGFGTNRKHHDKSETCGNEAVALPDNGNMLCVKIWILMIKK